MAFSWTIFCPSLGESCRTAHFAACSFFSLKRLIESNRSLGRLPPTSLKLDRAGLGLKGPGLILGLIENNSNVRARPGLKTLKAFFQSAMRPN